MEVAKSYQRLSEVTKTVTSQLSLKSVLETVVRLIADEVGGVDLVGYFQYQPTRNRFQGMYANKVPVLPTPEGPVEVPVSVIEIDPTTDRFAQEILDTLEPVYIEDATTDPRPDPRNVQLLNMKSIYGLPVHMDGEIFGLVFLHDVGKPMDLPPEKRQVVKSFVDIASVATKNARLFTDQQRLVRVTQEMAASLNVQQVLDTCFSNIVEVTGVETVGIHLLKDYNGRKILEPTYLKSNSKISQEEWMRAHQATGEVDLAHDQLFRDVVETKQMVVLEDTQADPRPDPLKILAFDISSMMLIPLVVGGEVIGTIAVASVGHPTVFPMRVQQICQSIAESTAVSLKNALMATNLDDLVQQRTEELTFANLCLESAVNELQGLDRMKSDFVASVSHELRTPINVIKQVVDLFRMGLLGETSLKQKEMLNKLAANVLRLHEQVEDLLDFSRLASGKLELHHEHVCYFRLVREVIESMDSLAEKKSIRIDGCTLETCPCGKEPPCLKADPKRLRQILINLLSNAIKFTQDGGQVTIRYWKEGDLLYTAVEDTGIGIDREHLERIWDKFYQVDNTSTRQYSGSGLGLSIVKSFVELHGGTIQVVSAPGQGSTFTFSLPLGGI